MYQCQGIIPELSGSRIRLRRLTERDADDLYRCWADERTSRYLYLPPITDQQDAKDLILLLNELAESDDSIRWGIELQDSGKIIGSCGYNGWQLKGAYRGEFGCELASPYWGRGYMREAAFLAIGYGFQAMGLNRIEALSDVRNEQASGFFRRFGFAQEGVLREYRHTSTGFVDVNVFSMLHSDWECK